MLSVELATKREEARALLAPAVATFTADLELDEVLPKWRDQRVGATTAHAERMHSCTELYRPKDPSHFNVLSLVNLDLDSGETSATGLLSDGWTVYASQDNLYIGQTSWWWWWGWGDMNLSTRIHKFSLSDGDEPTYVASGEVRGWTYDQFAFSEYNDHLRVTTTDVDWWWGVGQSDEDVEPGNNLFVLGDNDNGALKVVGSVEGYAPGERIMAARLMGDVGYVVTFEQTDPLFTFDLSDPEAPHLKGELTMPGFSSYLHPLGEDHLIGIGRDGNEDGQTFGVAINVFDVSDLTKPALTHQLTLNTGDWAWSEALWDHHAFTYHRGILSIPFYSYEDGQPFSGLVALSVNEDGISEVGRVNHRSLVADSECLYAKYYDYDNSVCNDWAWYASVRRSIYIEDNLFSLSNYGLKVNDLNHPDALLQTVLFYPAD
jgi:uncharacterized secreted protein with C-terminal beta-propeller domain